MYDRYVSPLSEPVIRTLCKQGDAVYFLPGQEIPHLEKTLDCAGRDGEGAWPSDHAGADR